MKELSIEEKAKAHDEALERAKKLQETCDSTAVVGWCEYIFPELKESEDERMLREIKKYIKEQGDKPTGLPNGTVAISDMITWLEKQGEQKHILDFKAADWYVSKVDGKIHNIYHSDKVEPKFHEGDWIVFNGLILHIDEVVNGYYRTTTIGYGVHNSYDWDIDNIARLWTIQDAKDGDVLVYVTDEEDLWIMIYWSLYVPYDGHVHYHALLVNDNFTDKGTCCICIDNLKPATKEQRDLLFQKMADAGYEWDAEKKELKKIKQKPADNVEPKFHIGEWLQYRNAKPFFVEEITEQGYCNGNSCLPFEWEDEIHLWTIKDAKEGDILAAEPIDNYMSPFVAIYANRGKDFFNSHCFISFDGQFCDEFTAGHSIDGIHPATKEQRDLLFEKMKSLA